MGLLCSTSPVYLSLWNRQGSPNVRHWFKKCSQPFTQLVHALSSTLNLYPTPPGVCPFPPSEVHLGHAAVGTHMGRANKRFLPAGLCIE